MMDLGFNLIPYSFSLYSSSAGLIGDDIFRWEVIIIGPPETAYEGYFARNKLIFIYFRRIFQSKTDFPKRLPDEAAKTDVHFKDVAPECPQQR